MFRLRVLAAAAVVGGLLGAPGIAGAQNRLPLCSPSNSVYAQTADGVAARAAILHLYNRGQAYMALSPDCVQVDPLTGMVKMIYLVDPTRGFFWGKMAGVAAWFRRTTGARQSLADASANLLRKRLAGWYVRYRARLSAMRLPVDQYRALTREWEIELKVLETDGGTDTLVIVDTRWSGGNATWHYQYSGWYQGENGLVLMPIGAQRIGPDLYSMLQHGVLTQ